MRLVGRRHAAVARRRRPDEREKGAPRVVVEVVDRDVRERRPECRHRPASADEIAGYGPRGAGRRRPAAACARRCDERRHRAAAERSRPRIGDHVVPTRHARGIIIRRMAALSRREFGRVVVAGLPLRPSSDPTRLFAAAGRRRRQHLQLPRPAAHHRSRQRGRRDSRAAGGSAPRTSSWRSPTSSPRRRAPRPFMGGIARLSAAHRPRRPSRSPPTNVAARSGAADLAGADTRSALRGRARRKLTAAGLTVHACAVAYNDSFTDDEIDATFRQVKALGARPSARR